MRNLLLSLLTITLLSGCKEITNFHMSKDLVLTVRQLKAEEDTFLAVVAFREDTPFNEVIQEVTINNAKGLHYQLVESFDTSWSEGRGQDLGASTVSDRHWTLNAKGWEHRQCKFYAGEVKNVDKDSVGFAMLPSNIDGSFKTKISKSVNQRYRRKREIVGEITRRHPDSGHYQIDWAPNEVVLTTKMGKVVNTGGQTRVLQSPWYMVQRQERNRMRYLIQDNRTLRTRSDRVAEITPKHQPSPQEIEKARERRDHNRMRYFYLQSPSLLKKKLPEGVAEDKKKRPEQASRMRERNRQRILYLKDQASLGRNRVDPIVEKHNVWPEDEEEESFK